MGQRIEGGGERAPKMEDLRRRPAAAEAPNLAAPAKITTTAQQVLPCIDALAKSEISIDEIKNDPATYKKVADGCTQISKYLTSVLEEHPK